MRQISLYPALLAGMSSQPLGISAPEPVTHVHESGTGALEHETPPAQGRHEIALSRTVKEYVIDKLLKILEIFLYTLSRPYFLCRAGVKSYWPNRQFHCQINGFPNSAKSTVRMPGTWKTLLAMGIILP
jgi:hypothetical protein